MAAMKRANRFYCERIGRDLLKGAEEGEGNDLSEIVPRIRDVGNGGGLILKLKLSVLVGKHKVTVSRVVGELVLGGNGGGDDLEMVELSGTKDGVRGFGLEDTKATEVAIDAEGDGEPSIVVELFGGSTKDNGPDLSTGLKGGNNLLIGAKGGLGDDIEDARKISDRMGLLLLDLFDVSLDPIVHGHLSDGVWSGSIVSVLDGVGVDLEWRSLDGDIETIV